MTRANLAWRNSITYPKHNDGLTCPLISVRPFRFFLVFLSCWSRTPRKIASSLTPAKLLRLWPAPLNVAVNIVIGAAMGWVAVKVTRPERRLVRPIIAVCSMGNAGNLPLVLVYATCGSTTQGLEGKPGLFGTYDECMDKGVSYVALGISIAILYMWGFLFEFLRPISEDQGMIAQKGADALSAVVTEHCHQGEDDDRGLAPTAKSGSSFKRVEMVAAANDPNIHSRTAATNHSEISHVGGGDEDGTASTVSDEEEEIFLLKCDSERDVDFIEPNRRWRGVVSRLVRQYVQPVIPVIRKACTPPVIASLLGITICFIPPLQTLVFSESAPLGVIKSSLEVLGAGMVPAMMLTLGSTLSNGPSSANLKLSTIIAVVLTRLILVPIIGGLVVVSASSLGLLPQASGGGDDKLFKYVLLLQQASPTAVNLIIAATLHNSCIEETASLLFFEYISSAVTLVFVLSGYLYLL